MLVLSHCLLRQWFCSNYRANLLYKSKDKNKDKNSVAPRHRKRQKALLPVDMRHRKTPLLKFSNLRRKDVDFPYLSSFTFVSLLFWVSQTHKLTGSHLRHGDVRDAAIELTLHSILGAYAPYPRDEILWCILKKDREGFHLHKERFTTPTSK